MKYLIAVLVLAVSLPAFSEPRYYMEYKHTAPFLDSNLLSEKITQDLRLGSKWDHFYFEAGDAMIDGHHGLGWEGGYKFKADHWEFKGKWEGRDIDSMKHKVETEVRYNF